MDDQDAAYRLLLDDLVWPVSPNGTTMMIPEEWRYIPAFHLVRCGWRRHEELAVIKKRLVVGPGLIENACEWVPLRAPDGPRRVGGNTPPPPASPGWQQPPTISIVNAPDDSDEPWH